MSSPCENGATCEPKDDSYKCKCGAGYRGTHCEGTYISSFYYFDSFLLYDYLQLSLYEHTYTSHH